MVEVRRAHRKHCYPETLFGRHPTLRVPQVTNLGVLVRGSMGDFDVTTKKLQSAQLSTHSTTTSERNLQFQDAISTGFSFSNFLQWIFCSRRYAERIWGEFFILVRRILGKIAGEFLSEFGWRILIANFDSEFFGLVFPGFQATKKIHAQKFTSGIVGIPLQFHVLEPKIYSLRFSAYGGDQDFSPREKNQKVKLSRTKA